ncbi:GNAT family N-acetyltransferase [Flammeovirga yaeyamensis]|uniref:GNAT family N-acetyltransferase n=1 Tax=Flammeovirga yaeyamensis TaxID=367791 RepID=A0AAX1N6V6_9BACT|nr:GNAT family N-acetyltransferase [Flammeovirga yaeyamensis]MBB3697891.1 ribosomal protein S18 acetylase RimI-like enzyme [Flammeovirga yaeyamensis]NMF35754.1 GNAT family N-acetyltransferase [Flammeovirga yaeyamensis]QWG03294.1 GNAT family N-acetyltransferase [Flammeovirga yaeyamensis]
MDITFKLVTTDKEIELVDQLAHQIWNEHYIPIIGKDQVDYMLDKFQNFKVMKDQLSEGFVYYLIQQNDASVGYIGYKIENQDLFLSKLYLLNAQRGKGQGQQSLRFIFEEARKHQLNGVKLTVNKYNEIAIKAYEKYGFEVVDEVVADIGQGYVMDDFILYKPV